ncbi:zwei Ig domain protein zig-8-like isoform X4 [Biomphalaria glabrata]|uniref:Zwei Ig domain protein zig-8-like isoform X4 n=1 Tax=Biomphalaria glabrata TaxID=6526 RepID=A0A9W2ZWW9_BIOGL|nr:zwei Ig domain protein zig-8-like isoform X4 [Biomphalaria glabrata]
MSIAKGSLPDTSGIIVPILASFMFFIDVSRARPLVTLPSMMDVSDSVTYDEGEMAVLFCSVDNLGDHTVVWRKLPQSAPLTIGSKSWTRDKRIHSEHVPNSSQWNLVVENVTVSDAGQYECHVSKRKSQLRHRVSLIVKAKPVPQLPRIEIGGENLLRSGETLQLTCNATLVDVSSERITWLKDGKPLLAEKDERFSIYTTMTVNSQGMGSISSKLDIKDVRVGDSGVYLCRSTERAQMAGVKVEVQGSPSMKRADKTHWTHTINHQDSDKLDKNYYTNKDKINREETLRERSTNQNQRNTASFLQCNQLNFTLLFCLLLGTFLYRSEHRIFINLD